MTGAAAADLGALANAGCPICGEPAKWEPGVRSGLVVSCTRCDLDRADADQVAETERRLERDTGEPSGRRVELVTAATIRPKYPRWLWADRLPAGELALAAGEPGVGKGVFTAWLAARISRGDLPGDLAGAPRIAVLASAEDCPARTVVPRLMAQGADLRRVRVVTVTVEGAPGALTLPDDVAALREGVEAEGAAIVVVDPIGAHLAGNVDSHKDASVRRALAPLALMAQETGAGVLAVAHLRSASAGTVSAKVMGSVAFTAAARNVLLAAEAPDGDGRVLAHAKSNTGALAPALRYRVEGREVEHNGEPIPTCGLAWLGEVEGLQAGDLLAPPEPEELGATDEARDWLVAYLDEHDGEAPAGQVIRAAERDGIARRTLQRARRAAGVETRKSGSGGWAWSKAPTEGANASTHEGGALAPSNSDGGSLSTEDAEAPRCQRWEVEL